MPSRHSGSGVLSGQPCSPGQWSLLELLLPQPVAHNDADATKHRNVRRELEIIVTSSRRRYWTTTGVGGTRINTSRLSRAIVLHPPAVTVIVASKICAWLVCMMKSL